MSLHYTAHAQLVVMKDLCRVRGFILYETICLDWEKVSFTTKKAKMEHYSIENMIRKYG